MPTSLRLHLTDIKCSLWKYYSGIELQIAKFPAWIVATAVLLAAAAAFCLSLTSRTSFLSKYANNNNNQENTLRVLPAMLALSLVFTPSSGGWPSQFASYFRCSRIQTSHSGQWVQLDLGELLDHLSSGAIELRDVKLLAHLFRGQLKVYDWDVRLRIGHSWWLLASKWMASQQLYAPLVGTSSSVLDSKTFNGKLSNDPQRMQSVACCPSYDLDYVCYNDIENEILRIQRIHRPGSTFVVEFSCRASGIGFLSPPHILCFIPFQYTSRSNQNHIPGEMYRTSTPLLLTLQRVVSAMSNERLSILSITNISSEHADSLLVQEKELATSKDLRNHVVSNRGLTGWRKRRLALVWQAGLLSAGLLIRWRIVLNINARLSE